MMTQTGKSAEDKLMKGSKIVQGLPGYNRVQRALSGESYFATQMNVFCDKKMESATK